MTEDTADELPVMDDDIHVASENSPILTAYEPDFRRVFARGTLLRIDEEYPETIQVGFWSSRDEDVEFDDGEESGVGYRLETEVMMTWDSLLRLRKLLDNYIDDHAPEEYLD